MDAARAYVLAALAHAGLEPSEAEVDALVVAYPAASAAIESLYRVPGVRYEMPAITFVAEPPPAPGQSRA